VVLTTAIRLPNPGGAAQSIVMPASSTLPAPAGLQSKAPLPANSLPANVPASATSAIRVTDANGDYIPAGSQQNR